MVNLTGFRIAKELLYSFPTILGRACGPSICVTIRMSRYEKKKKECHAMADALDSLELAI